MQSSGPCRRHRHSRLRFLLVALLGGFSGYGGAATEFGGMVLGRENEDLPLLRALGAHGTMPWIRGQTAAIQAHGLRAVGDVRYLFPRQPGEPTDRLPTDLLKVRDLVREGVLQSPHIGTWEIWNEPDFHFVRDSAADMAAVLKAAWWGVKSARSDDRVLMPSMAFRPGRYAVELMHNGAASYTEAYHLHFYGWASDYARVLAHHRVLARAAGLDRPEWVTEVGDLRLPTSAADDPEALARQAAFHERMMVESTFEGVGVHLAFAFSPAREASWDLGLTEPDGRWRPALRSMVRLAARLRHAAPQFRLIHRSTGECFGIALRETQGDAESQWWMALWSPARGRDSTLPGVNVAPEWPEKFPVTVRWPKGTTEVRVGLEGETALAPEQVGALELSPSRVHHLRVRDGALPRVTGCDWRRADDDGDGGVQVGRFWRRELSTIPPRTAASPVVLQWITGPGACAEKASQTVNVRDGAEGELRLRAVNLGSDEVHGHWRVEAPQGWEISTAAFEGAWTLPASGTIEAPVQLRLGHGVDRRTVEPARLSAHWQDHQGRRDQASIRLRAQPCDGDGDSGRRAWRAVSWREWRPRPGHPGAWQVFEPAPGVGHLEVREPAGAQADVVVCWEVPRGMTVQDGWGADLRRVATGGRVFAQVSLVTRDGEVWRHDELREVPASEPWRVRAILSDFAPTVWSRHLRFGRPDPHRVRWVVLRFQGVRVGDVVALSDVHWFGGADRQALGRKTPR